MTFDAFAKKLGGYNGTAGMLYHMPVWSRSQVEEKVGAPEKVEMVPPGASLTFKIDTGQALVIGPFRDDSFFNAVIVHLPSWAKPAQ